MRSGFPGNNEQLLSLFPRSSETGVLGVNMAEYVLGGAPVVRDRDPRDPRLLTMKGRYVSFDPVRFYMYWCHNSLQQM